MNSLRYILVKLLMNKYFVATLLFTLYLFFFDRFNVPSQMRRLSEIRSIERYRQFYVTEIGRNKATLEELQSGNEALEEFGRETYFMKRDNEDIFIVEQETPAQ